MTDRMSRRRLLGGALAAAGAVLVGERWRALVVIDRGLDYAGVFAGRTAAVAVGRWYLAGTPAEASSAVLTDAVGAALPAGALATRAALRRAARSRIDHELATGDVVLLDGWIVSRTEARLCALAALARPGPWAS